VISAPACTDLLIFTVDFPPLRSSVSEVCYELGSHLAKSGLQVAVLAPAVAGEPVESDRNGVRVHRREMIGVRGLGYVRAGLRLSRFVRSLRPRAVLATSQAPCRALGTLPSLGSPVYVLIHGSDVRASFGEPNPIKEWWKARAYRMASRVLANSRYTSDLARGLGIPAEKLVVTYLGLNAQVWGSARKGAPACLREHGLPGDKRVILSVCRLDPRKGLDVLLRALPSVLREVPNAVYVAAGMGPDEARLRRIAAEVGVADRTIFLGFVDDEDKVALFDACDVFVQPSRAESRWVEGFGLTFLEAAARGKPSVGGRHGAVPEVVVDGETGLLVDPSDSAELAAAIVRVLRDPALAARLGEAGRRRALGEFSWERRSADFARALGLT